MEKTALIEAVGLGLCAWDTICLLERFPQANQKVEALASVVCGGGPVPNALAIFAKLGGRAAFIGATGDDHAGLSIKSELKAYGVDVSHLKVRKGQRSSCAYVWVDERNGARTVALMKGDAEELATEELPEEFIRTSPLLLLDGRNVELSRCAAALCHQGGGQVVLDAGSTRPGLLDLLPYVDHAVVSSDCARSLYPQRGFLKALRALQKPGVRSVVITQGDQGGCWREGEYAGVYPAFALPVL
ncbi:MAG: PfkB family carbohydrate kinase, partial [bacterium]